MPENRTYNWIVSNNKTNDANTECVSCPNIELLDSGKSDRADKVPDNFDYQMIDEKIISLAVNITLHKLTELTKYKNTQLY